MALFKSAFIISFFTAISRILGFIRDVLIANFLGVSLLSDVFFAAFRLPNFFRRIFAEGAFNAAFVPIFVEQLHNKNGKNKALLFVRNILSFLFYILLVLIILMQIFMPAVTTIMFPGFINDPEKFTLAVDLSRITIFYLFFISIVSLFSGVLNSIGKFAAPSCTPIILNLTLIFSLYLLTPIAPNLAYALSFGVFIAGILQLSWLTFFLLKEKMLIYPSYPKITPKTKLFFKKLLPGIIGANVMQINLLVDTLIASLIPGAISYLYYADRVNQLPLAMIGIAIGVALLPPLSKKIKEKKEQEAIKLQNIALEISLILVIPAALALSFLSYPIISVLFERGKFTNDEVILVADALKFYAIGLPAYVIVKVLEPAFFSRGNTKTPMKIALVCLLSNIILNVIFFKPFGYIGIVFASVLSSYLNVFLITSNLISKKYFKFNQGFVKKIIKILISAILMIFIIMFLGQYIQINHVLGLAAVIAVGLVSFFTISYLTGSLNILIKKDYRS